MLKNLKKYKLILIDENSLGVKEFNSKKVFYSLLTILACMFFFLIISLYSTDINKLITFKAITKHKANNTKLHQIIKNQEKQINVLIKEIKDISERDENLRKLVKLPPINTDIRKLGVGGGTVNDKINDVNYLLPSNIKYDFIDKINFIKRSINLENLSYSELENEANKNLDKLLHTPAIYPISRKDSRFSSGYGYRIDPFSKKRKHHKGHDFSAKIGTEVLSTANGIVKSSRKSYISGNYIEIDHGNGYATAYTHLSERLVKKGDKVIRGDIIGKVGNTGKSTAPHLHYEISLNNKHINPKDFYYDLSFSDK